MFDWGGRLTDLWERWMGGRLPYGGELYIAGTCSAFLWDAAILWSKTCSLFYWWMIGDFHLAILWSKPCPFFSNGRWTIRAFLWLLRDIKPCSIFSYVKSFCFGCWAIKVATNFHPGKVDNLSFLFLHFQKPLYSSSGYWVVKILSTFHLWKVGDQSFSLVVGCS